MTIFGLGFIPTFFGAAASAAALAVAADAPLSGDPVDTTTGTLTDAPPAPTACPAATVKIAVVPDVTGTTLPAGVAPSAPPVKAWS